MYVSFVFSVALADYYDDDDDDEPFFKGVSSRGPPPMKRGPPMRNGGPPAKRSAPSGPMNRRKFLEGKKVCTFKFDFQGFG